MNAFRRSIVICIANFLLCQWMIAQQQAQLPVVPRLVSFSGKATDAQGKIVAGTAGATFAIYKDQYEGSPLWIETQNVQPDAKGTYTVQLGATKPSASRSLPPRGRRRIMECSICAILFWSMVAVTVHGQKGSLSSTDPRLMLSVEGVTYTVQGTTPERELLLRAQIRIMQPTVLPNRIIFVPHWQYIYATRMYHLQVPTGMTSKMFTHLLSRSIYIDADFYGGEDWLGHWMAHELGHLERNNADENQAEKTAAVYRSRLNHSH